MSSLPQYQQQTAASARKRNRPPAEARPRRSPSSQQSSSSSQLPTLTAEMSHSGASQNLSAKNFGAATLDRYGIHIEDTELSWPFENFSTEDGTLPLDMIPSWPCCHFGTKAPPEGESITYGSLEGLDAAKVGLSIDKGSITDTAQGYEAMKRRTLCETEYTMYTIEKFFKGRDRKTKTTNDGKWRTERMLQLAAPPDSDKPWIIPPRFVDANNKFDARPDCSYWLSLAGFNRTYRSEMSSLVYVHDDWLTCPYFTIVFKKHDESDQQARAQLPQQDH